MITTTEQVIAEETFQESDPDIVKVRVMGTIDNIIWIRALLKKNPFFNVIDQSDIYSNQGTKKYFRSYLLVARKNDEKNIKDIRRFRRQNRRYWM